MGFSDGGVIVSDPSVKACRAYRDGLQEALDVMSHCINHRRWIDVAGCADHMDAVLADLATYLREGFPEGGPDLVDLEEWRKRHATT